MLTYTAWLIDSAVVLCVGLMKLMDMEGPVSLYVCVRARVRRRQKAKGIHKFSQFHVIGTALCQETNEVFALLFWCILLTNIVFETFYV